RSDRSTFRRIEALVSACHRYQQVGRFEPVAMASVERVQATHDFVRAERVDIPERSAAEGREAESEHRADVPVARRTQDSFLQTTHGLVDHREHAAPHDVRSIDGGFGARWRCTADQRVDRRIHAALLATLVVEIKTGASLATGAAGFHHASHTLT